jgi:hypothetical protein
MNIKICKLVDGSLVIGKLDDEGLTDAVEVYMQNLHDGLKVSLMPIMYPFNQELAGMFIPKNRILCTTESREDLKNNYIEAISGIIIPGTTPGLHLVK